jgi:hypothetical protein
VVGEANNTDATTAAVIANTKASYRRPDDIFKQPKAFS